MQALRTDNIPPSTLRSVMTWASLSVASALPTAALLFLFAGPEDVAWDGVLIGLVFWVAALTSIDLRVLRGSRGTRNRVLIRGIKIQAIAVLAIFVLTHGLGFVVIYAPAVLALTALESCARAVFGIEWAIRDLSGVAAAALTTVVFGGCHFLAAVVLGLMFRPTEPTSRWRPKAHSLGAAVAGRRSA